MQPAVPIRRDRIHVVGRRPAHFCLLRAAAKILRLACLIARLRVLDPTGSNCTGEPKPRKKYRGTTLCCMQARTVLVLHVLEVLVPEAIGANEVAESNFCKVVAWRGVTWRGAAWRGIACHAMPCHAMAGTSNRPSHPDGHVLYRSYGGDNRRSPSSPSSGIVHTLV